MDAAVRVLAGAGLIAGVRARRRPGSPAELARRLDPSFRVTPTIRLLSDIMVRSVMQPDQRDIVTTPPRTGKSQTTVVWTIVWALMMNPDLLVIVAAYGDDLAEEHSRKARRIIQDHGEFLGYQLAADKTAVKRWTVEGRRGGVLAAGIQSGITGMGADLLLIDDPLKGQADADSPTIRRKILAEYRSTLAPRVHPRGSVAVIQTRWHEADLAGSLLEQEPDVWRHTNVPAVAEAGISDALCRRPGVAMVSALGYTPDHYAAMRRTSGERAWFALYQGVPSAPEGGLVKRAWLDLWRLPAAPAYPVRTIVAVDPSDSGSGDSCGIVAASLTQERVVAFIADRSAPMTSDQWARTAVDLAIDLGASQITVEGFAARETYLRILREALARRKPAFPIAVTAWPPKGRARVGDAIARSAALLQAFETGTARIAGQLPDFEAAACAWQAGQHQPDSLAAAVIAEDELSSGVGRRMGLSGVPGAGRAGSGVSSLRPAVAW